MSDYLNYFVGDSSIESSSIFFCISVDFNIFYADGLCFGFNWSKFFITFESYFEYVGFIGSYFPAVTASNSPSISSALNGGCRVAISYRTQPKDQMSDFVS